MGGIGRIGRVPRLPASHRPSTLFPCMDIVCEDPDLKFEDIKFIAKFLNKRNEYSEIEEVYRAVEEYQTDSGFRIVIRSSAGSARCYFCTSHASCCFRAKLRLY
jgi:hypothetical protein